MNRIDTIVAALEFASDNSDKANFEYHIVEKALAAARELKELKPVAWMIPKFGDVISADETDGIGIYNIPLYALEVTK
jgi:hypothetical protein